MAVTVLLVAARLTTNSDLRILVPMLTDQFEQNSRVGGMQPDATMRNRCAEPVRLIRSVDGVTAPEEN